jgi:hypothetical protein
MTAPGGEAPDGAAAAFAQGMIPTNGYGFAEKIMRGQRL